MSSTRLITTKGFLQKIGQRNKNRKERPFCFIIGAGASRSAGIATGTELAKGWLEDLYADLNFDNLSLVDWATEKNLGIKDFNIDEIGSFYPQIYRRRFSDSPQDGYACLEDKMQGVEPSFGYSILAYLLSNTPHKIVITTNFDNLVADSLSIHSTTFPIVVSDDSLARYAQVDLRRPLIAKVHGGLGFSMKSAPAELDHLSDAWKNALQQILSRYTPIVIGYEGNDGSLMKCLEDMEPASMEGIYWCFHCPEGDAREQVKKLRAPILKLVEDKKGHLVPIPGFDELMLLIRNQNCLSHSIPNLLEAMAERAREREKSYEEQEKQLSESITKNKNQHDIRPKSGGEQTTGESKGMDDLLQKALENLAQSHKEKPWWKWQNEASAATTKEDKDLIYKKAIKALPTSAPLLGNYAFFLKNERKEFDKVEEFYKRAIEADPKHANNLGNYAVFLNERKEFDKAEEFYKRAIEADPKKASILSNYAIFLNERKEFDKAEEFYKRAIEADPKNASILSNYAVFLNNDRKEFDKAEEFYKRAIEADPKHASSLGNYAVFLNDERKELDKAEEFYKCAIEADPKHATNLGNYAQFIFKRGDNQGAMQLLEKAEQYCNNDTLRTELAFYRLVHDKTEAWKNNLLAMKQLIQKGLRTPEWSFASDITVAKEAKHPHLDLLQAIDDVLTKDAPASGLDKYPDWVG
jgi:protein O-mannosyl-transferase